MLGPANILNEANRFLADTVLTNETDDKGQRWLQIPGHEPRVLRSLEIRRDPLEIRLTRRPNREFYEAPATLLLSYLLTRFKPKVFFDLGAGYFSFIAASHQVAKPEVHGFDMNPGAYDALKRYGERSAFAGRMHAHLVGFTDKHVGVTRIWFARTRMFEHEPSAHEYREPWWIRLKFALQLNKQKRQQLNSAEVLLTTLDRFCSDEDITPDLIKIDVDGYEGKVLRGANEVLRSQPIVLLELHRQKVLRGGFTRRDVADILFDRGYSAFFLADHNYQMHSHLFPADRGHPNLDRETTDMILFLPQRLQNGP